MTLRSYSAAPDANPGDNPCYPQGEQVLKRTHAYTVVGEHHAYWDAKGELTYLTGATTSVGVYQNVSGKVWSFMGYLNFSATSTLSMGVAEGPYNSHQDVVSLKYEELRGTVVCLHGGGYTFRQIQEDGLYNPGHNWVVFKDARNVIRFDGRRQYRKYLKKHPTWVNVIPPNDFFAITKNKALTYGVAATVFGVGIKAETTHSQSVAQEYFAGSSTARRHHVWGDTGPFTSAPKVVYSY
jgi:hypothetical protein